VASALTKFVTSGSTTGTVNFPIVEVPPPAGTRRILNITARARRPPRHQSHRFGSERQHPQPDARDRRQHRLPRDGHRPGRADEVYQGIAALETNIRTRIVLASA